MKFSQIEEMVFCIEISGNFMTFDWTNNSLGSGSSSLSLTPETKNLYEILDSFTDDYIKVIPKKIPRGFQYEIYFNSKEDAVLFKMRYC